MLDKKTQDRILGLVSEGRWRLSGHAQMRLWERDLFWSRAYIEKCLQKGLYFAGTEMYPNEEDRLDRCYCLHKHTIVSRRVAIFGMVIERKVVIVHAGEVDPGSKEGIIYYKFKASSP